MTLIDCLKEVEDSRRMQGQRYHSVAMLFNDYNGYPSR